MKRMIESNYWIMTYQNTIICEALFEELCTNLEPRFSSILDKLLGIWNDFLNEILLVALNLFWAKYLVSIP